ncbi:putative membrane protein [Halapricum desulfuricans]|uniref:Putative membrane protein n=1 Tax=Halapricum desulfuricans TaxID=2841257 RepID=A0A897ND00_9EURY|nr:hypothetical protein [Halapricum desulfuricans]QSG12290.1 putative membrane protein [Halapricum desulfuricans]
MAAEPFDEPGSRTALDVGSVFSNALDELLSVTGAQVVAALTLLGVVTTTLWNSLFVRAVEWTLATIRDDLAETDPEVEAALQDPQVQDGLRELERSVESVGPAVDAPVPAILLGILALALLVEAAKIVATRAFAADELDGVPASLATYRLAVATLFGFLTGLALKIVITLTAGVTFFLLAIPALFVFVGTMLYRQEIAIADKGPLAAISGSWGLVKGNRWRMLAIAVVLFVVWAIVWAVTTAISGTAGVIVAALLSAIEVTFGVAVVTEAYVRLRGEPAERQPSV